MPAKLTILIPTLEKRRVKFEMLLTDLGNQIRSHRLSGKVKILTNKDNGEKTIGQKRNELSAQAVLENSEYSAFLDDDDRVAYNYLPTLIEKIKHSPDCVELKGIITTNGYNPQKFIHSIKYRHYFEENRVYYRPPNHLNCIRTELVSDIKFPSNNFGEDTSWAMEVLKQGRLKTMEPIDDVIYFYDYVSNK